MNPVRELLNAAEKLDATIDYELRVTIRHIVYQDKE